MNLKEIQDAMAELTCNCDLEAEHVQADTLLMELARCLSRNADKETQDIVASILEHYDMVGKWYA